LSSTVLFFGDDCSSICAGSMPVPVHFNLVLRLIQLWDPAKKKAFCMQIMSQLEGCEFGPLSTA
jgi:hypothetical protein